MAIASPLRGEWLGSRLVHRRMSVARRRNQASTCALHTITTSLEEISQNHVLTSAALAGLSAQLIKPVTSAVAGKGFNWKLILKSGGTPSSHSASMVAAATALGLERGFTDSLFGFALVVAGIVMYDAQGVRREVGKHAEVLNTMSLTQLAGEPSPRSRSKSLVHASAGSVNSPPSSSEAAAESSSSSSADNAAFSRSPNFFRAAENLPSIKDGEVSIQEIGDETGLQHIPLKESIGHTKVQVLAGALYGITVSVLFHAVGLS